MTDNPEDLIEQDLREASRVTWHRFANKVLDDIERYELTPEEARQAWAAGSLEVLKARTPKFVYEATAPSAKAAGTD